MSGINDFEIVADAQGIALFGEGKEIDKFLKSEGLVARPLEMSKVIAVAGKASTVTKSAAEISANAGRWVKLSEKSAHLANTSKMMEGSTGHLVRGVFTGDKGKIKGIVEFVRPGAGLANPMVISNISGMMTQMALQQSIDEIAEYLAVIDAKIDDILRIQKDAVIADMIGVGFVIDEAMTLRSQMGKVSDITWSKVQGTSFQLARTQAFALLQLDDISKNLAKEKSIASLVKATQEAERPISEWLALLARCSQLNDSVGILELDRVLDSAPEDVESHKEALNAARQKRLDLITASTSGLINEVRAVANYADKKLLLNPFESPEVIRSSNLLGERVEQFQKILEIDSSREELTARIWAEAAIDFRDEVLDTTKHVSSATISGTKKVVGKSSDWVSKQAAKLKKTD